MPSPPQHWWRRTPAGVRLAALAWLAVAGGVTARVAVQRPTRGTVVPIYLSAAARFVAGADLYDRDPTLDLYRNPPGVAVGFVPLLTLPPKAVGIGWRWAGVGLLVAGGWRFARAAGLSANRAGCAVAVSAVLAVPAVNNGQVNVHLAGAVLLGLAATHARRLGAAAGWFGLAFGLKVYPLAAGLLACVVSPRLAPRLALAGGVAVAVPFLARDPEYVAGQYASFVAHLSAEDRTYAAAERVPRDWTVVPRTWCDAVPPPAVTKAASVLAGLAAAGVVLLARRSDTAVTLAGVLGCVWMTACGPGTEGNTYALVAVPAAVTLLRPGPLGARLCGTAGVALLLAAVLRGMSPEDWRFQMYGPQPVGAGLVAVAAVWQTFARVGANAHPSQRVGFGWRTPLHPTFRRSRAGKNVAFPKAHG